MSCKMKRIDNIAALIIMLGSCFLVSCSSPNRQLLSYQLIGNDTLYTCDILSVPDEETTVKLSDLITSFHVVHFEDKDTALFKSWKVYISNHYIGILSGAQSPFKLFDHQGKFLCDVGSIGQAEGEYTMLYSGAINEQDSAVWLAPFNGTHLWKYNMSGECISSYQIQKMNKPVIRCEKDNTLTATNLYFLGMPGCLYLRLFPNDSIYYSDAEQQYAFSPRDKEGNFMGYNHEVWFSNNVEDFVYMTTCSDTLYSYDIEEDRTIPRFAASSKMDGRYYILDELPSHFLMGIFSFVGQPGDKRLVLADKVTGEVSYVNILNDFMGNLPVKDFRPSNGWYYQMFEPYELVELIEQTLADEKVSKEDRSKLEELLSGIDEDGNNILFMGELKKKKGSKGVLKMKFVIGEE